MKDLHSSVIQELVGGGVCHLHHHETIITHQDLEELWEQELVTSVSANYTVSDRDDIVLADSSAGNVTLTLPLAKGRRLIVITKAATVNNVTVNFTGGQLCLGAASVTMLALGEVKRFKAYNDGWILV